MSFNINWMALTKANDYYHAELRDTYNQVEWFEEVYGIEWTSRHVKIVDEQKYILFLLEWA